MRIRTRNLGCAVLALAALLAWDIATMTAGSRPGWEAKRLSAQETEVRNQQDEERMFMEARRALNREEVDRAAELFQALRDKYPVSNTRRYGRFIADSYYWEAFGRYRQEDLDEALMLLDLASVYPETQSNYFDGRMYRSGRLYRDVRDLRARIQRQLAEQGDPRAVEEVLRQSERVLARDTAALREMRWEMQAEAQLQAARADRAQQRARFESETQEAIALYNAQLDSSRSQLNSMDPLGILRLNQQDQLLAQLAQAQRLEALAAGARGRNPFLTGLNSGVVGRIDIDPECVNALIDQEAFTSLLRLDTERMPTVRSMLERNDDCSAHLRYMAVNWLAQEDTDEARNLLTEVAGEHPDTRTRQWAVTRLANFEAPEVAEVLMNILRDSDDQEMQGAAIAGLSRQQSDEATQALIEFATDGSKPTLPRQRAAIVTAERLASGSLWRVFGRLDTDAVKRAFLRIVGSRAGTGEQGVTGWLLPVVMDTEHSEDVRSAALQAWSRQPSLDLEQVERTYGMLESAELRDQFFYALYQKAEFDEENADAVIDKMIELAREETDPEVRKRAIYWLGRTGSERAAAFLQEILRERSDQPPG